MEVQETLADFDELVLLDLPANPQEVMIERCLRFQERLGKWSDDIVGFGPNRFINPRVALHNLDMAVQEASEAWDLIEGGWKHHKTKPRKGDRAELLMELVDVAHFVFNAYLYLGGYPDASRTIAEAHGIDHELNKLTAGNYTEVWSLVVEITANNQTAIDDLFGHGAKSHGEEWEKRTATLVNFMRAAISRIADNIRLGVNVIMEHGKSERTELRSAAPDIFGGVVSSLYAAADSIPGVDARVFYSAFIKKNDINFERQHNGY